MAAKIKIIVCYDDGTCQDITDNMYWFEENFVDNMNDRDPRHDTIEVFVGDVLVWASRERKEIGA